jgi:hypothetical protein
MNKNALPAHLIRLRRHGPVDPTAVAFMLTEMHFRGALFRILEVAYAASVIYFLRREPNITLGLCQVSFCYWRARYGANNLRLLRAVFDEVENYRICCDYLHKNHGHDIHRTIIAYNGRPSALYVKLFFGHLELIMSVIAALKATHLTRAKKPQTQPWPTA